MTNSRALGTENVKKLIWQLGTPAMLAQLINMLYNIVDRIYLGRLEGMGSYALSGIGISGPVIILITAFASMIGGGGAPLAAISLGSGDKEHANDIMQVCFSLAIIMSVLLSILSYTFKKDLLFMFEMSGVENIVDALGGVDITVTNAEAKYLRRYAIPADSTTPAMTFAGTYHFRGHSAVIYMRKRKQLSLR